MVVRSRLKKSSGREKETRLPRISLRDKMFKIEPKIDLLHEVMGFGEYEEVTETSDGFFLARPKGSIGFDAFLGKPSEVAKERTRKIYSKLSPAERTQVDFKISMSKINRKDIGLKKLPMFQVI
jgi:hypothetical protein